MTFSTSRSMSCWASSPIAPVRAGTSHTRENRRPDLPGSRTHTVPVALATSIAAARSITTSWSASGISTGPATTAGFCLCLRCAPTSLALQSNPSIPSGGSPGGLGKGKPKF